MTENSAPNWLRRIAATPTLTWVMLMLGSAVIAGLLMESTWVNGAPWWKWQYRPDPDKVDLFSLIVATLPAMLLCLAMVSERAKGVRPLLRLAGLLAASAAFVYVPVAFDVGGLDRVRAIILSPGVTSYFTDAARIDDLHSFLSTFHKQSLHLHSSSHPPGPIVWFYGFIKLHHHDLNVAARRAGLALTMLAPFGSIVMYYFASLWTDSVHERVVASAIFALLPSLCFFSPGFDQLYPSFAMALIYFFVQAVRQASLRHAVCLGLALTLACSFAYNLLALGAFHVLYAAAYLFKA
ncbi:MAG: hypothetical protein ACPGUV_14760, partial [Polyangiales bacterium]